MISAPCTNGWPHDYDLSDTGLGVVVCKRCGRRGRITREKGCIVITQARVGACSPQQYEHTYDESGRCVMCGKTQFLPSPATENSGPIQKTADVINHPHHYTNHPSGVECITITEHMGFCLGNAMKYIWRADLKNDAIEDLKKAKWYIEREIARREKK